MQVPMRDKTYMGIDKDPKGAMNPTGNIIRDAWVFGLIPDTETCAGWTTGRIEALYDRVTAEIDGILADIKGSMTAL